MTLMTSQPRIDVTSPVHATAAFDPPIVSPGESSIYRITLNALEESVDAPAQLPAPAGLELRRGAHGQIFQMAFNSLIPISQLNYHVRTTNSGTFTVPEFTIQVYGKAVTVPATQIQVMQSHGPVPSSPKPVLELAQTNLLAGQSVSARVVLFSTANAGLQTLGQVQFNGGGVVVDQGSVRQRIESKALGGANAVAFIFDILITPIQSGTLTLSAQGFTSRNAFSGPIVMPSPGMPPGSPQQTLVETAPVQLTVKPLPVEGRLPGFSGAIGKFEVDTPRLATNVLRVGDPVRMDVLVQSEGTMPRLVPPPAPFSKDWQIVSANEAVQIMQPQGAATIFHYTFVPLTADVQGTPPIPFSCYDPERPGYVDLTIPSVPVTVTPGTIPSDLLALLRTNRSLTPIEEPLTLAGLVSAPGFTAQSLTPLQLQGWFPLVQLVPAIGFIALVTWDRRRRYLEKHPDVVIRARARRALRRERRLLRHAANHRDAAAFARSAVNALRVVCAPHYPAEPRALVGSDILAVLSPDDGPQGPSLVRRIFSRSDAANFSTAAPAEQEVFSWQPELEQLLTRLEQKL